MKPAAGQEAVVDLHADDSHISEDEGDRHGEPAPHDKGLKICRTVTQVRQPLDPEAWVPLSSRSLPVSDVVLES